jgi:hypothetical protein
MNFVIDLEGIQYDFDYFQCKEKSLNTGIYLLSGLSQELMLVIKSNIDSGITHDDCHIYYGNILKVSGLDCFFNELNMLKNSCVLYINWVDFELS